MSTPEIRILAWRGVAQLGSAGALGALGRRFESCRPDLNLSECPKALGVRLGVKQRDVGPFYPRH